MFDKLGAANSAAALLLNPKIGAAHKSMLHQIIADGHELGLHGGKNHATWEKNAKDWSEKKVMEEIDYGLKLFSQFQLQPPVSFASPCWQSPAGINSLLKQKGFGILADVYSANQQPDKDSLGLLHFPTNIIGKNGNVGFVENLRALGYSSEQILSEFESQLHTEGDFKMVFDHPFYIGTKEQEVVLQMIEISLKNGYTIESLHNISRHIE